MVVPVERALMTSLSNSATPSFEYLKVMAPVPGAFDVSRTTLALDPTVICTTPFTWLTSEAGIKISL